MNKDFFSNPYCHEFRTNDVAHESSTLIKQLLGSYDKKIKDTSFSELKQQQRCEFFARQLYSIFNSTSRQSVSIEACRDVANHYHNIHDFANYGLAGFVHRYNLTSQQKDAISTYADKSEIDKYHIFDGVYLGTWEALSHFIYNKFNNEYVENAYIIYVNASLNVIGTYKKTGYQSNVHLEPFDIKRHRPFEDKVGYFLVHNHIAASARPSKDDFTMTVMFDYLMNPNDTQLLDSLIVSENRVFSIMHNKVVLIGFSHKFYPPINYDI